MISMARGFGAPVIEPPGNVALTRSGLDCAATDSEEPFRTRGQQAVVSGLEESSERRGRAFPEALVRGGGRPSQRKRDAMGEIDLEDLPLVYRPFRFFDGVDVLIRIQGFDRR